MANASDPVSYVPLEAGLLQSFGVSAPTFSAGQETSLFTSSSFLYTFAFVIIIVTASFRYALAGVLRMQASEDGIKKSKEEFTRVTYGLLGVLGLWLVLFTVNKDMLTGDVTLSSLKLKPTTSNSSVSSTNSGTKPTTGETTPVSNANESTVRKQFSDAGITINKDPCKGNETGCTNVGGLQSHIIKAVLALKSKCKCAVQITGGSEPGGHSANSNHTTGNAVDISLTPELTTFFENPLNNSLKIGNTPPCNIKYGFAGLIFWDEAKGCDSVGGERHYHASLTGR